MQLCGSVKVTHERRKEVKRSEREVLEDKGRHLMSQTKFSSPGDPVATTDRYGPTLER